MVTSFFEQVHYGTNNADVAFGIVRMKQALVRAGFTAHEANCIYHEHFAPMNDNLRSVVMSHIKGGAITPSTKTGKHLLSTSRGL